ncbi:hypothetical protein BGZ94_000550, partial [Podila epigama]
EAPPVILSCFLGEHLTEVLNSIEEGRPIKNFSVPNVQTIKLGGTALDVKFRAVGSKQSPAFPVTILNAAVASALQDVSAALREQMGEKPFPSDADKVAVIKKFITLTKPIRFEGDGYSEAWIHEAEKRGLPNIKTCPEAFAQLNDPVHISMLTKLGIFSKSELTSRFLIMNERYAKDLLVEANTMRTMLASQILPSAFEYRGSLAKTVSLLNTIPGESESPELIALKTLTPIVKELQAAIAGIDKALAQVHAIHDDAVAEAEAAQKYILPAMTAARDAADRLEAQTANAYYPIPTYSELLWF